MGIADDAASLKSTVQLCGVELPLNTQVQNPANVPALATVEWSLTPSLVEPTRFLAKAYIVKKPVLLVGPTGVGKTFAVRQLAAITQSEFVRLNLSYFTEVEDLLGRHVGGTSQHTRENLEEKSDTQVRGIANDLALGSEGGRLATIGRILAEQQKIRWVDGPVVKAMRAGAILLLDEINLARPAVIEALNGLFDRGQLVTQREIQRIDSHANFCIFATMNPPDYEGRQDISPALLSRWMTLEWDPIPAEELLAVVQRKYGDTLPMAHFARLILAHHALAGKAEKGEIGHDRGGIAYTLRDLYKVADRFLRYAPRSSTMTAQQLLAREARSVYLTGLADKEDQRRVLNELRRALPEVDEDFVKDLKLERTTAGWRIGDVDIVDRHTGHPFVPSIDLVMTPSALPLYYEVAKAVDMGENVALMGERASGKSATAEKYAADSGLAFYPEHFDDGMDGSRLIGTDTQQGWQDGLLVHAMRNGGVLLADELNLSPAEILERLNSLLDEERILVLSEKESERITAHPDFIFIATLNPPKYAGRHKLSRAMLNRLTCIHVATLESEKDLRPIVSHKLSKSHQHVPNSVNAAVTGALLGLHAWTTEQFATGKLGSELRRKQVPDFSLRQVLDALMLTVPFTPREGVVLAVADALRMCYAQRGSVRDKEAIRSKIDALMQEVEKAVENADPMDLAAPLQILPLVETAASTENQSRTLIRDQSVYNGDIVDGVPHGEGIERFLDGTTYQGEFSKGLRHGRGVLQMVDRVYTGDFVQGQQQGKGILRFSNNDRYEGDFVDGTFDGKGIYFYASGRCFDGDFAKGRPLVGSTYGRNGERRHYAQAGSSSAAVTPTAPDVLNGFDMGLDIWVANAPLDVQSKYQQAAQAIRQCKSDRWGVTLDVCGLALETLPSELGELTNLRTLKANGNRLSKMPRELQQLSQLECLELAKNEFKDLPAFLGQMPHLASVALADNMLTEMPAALAVQPNLRTVDLRRNTIRAIPPAFWEKQTLTQVMLDQNELRALPADLSRLRRLETLSVSDNKIKDLPESIVKLASLQHLNVERNDIDALPKELEKLADLQSLRLMGNRVTVLPTSLAKLSKLRTLSIDPHVGVVPRELEHNYYLTQIILPPRAKTAMGWMREKTFEETLPFGVRDKIRWSDGK